MRKIDFGGRDWSAHCQEEWLVDALNPRWPGPLRVAFVAFGSHSANGHAVLKQGELAKLLPLGTGEDGLPVKPTRQTLNRWIKTAVEYGFLDEGSKVLCLIVPKHRAQGGKGNPNDPCKRHPAPAKRHAPGGDVRPPNVTTGTKRFDPKRHAPESDVSRSRPLSSPPGPAGTGPTPRQESA